MRLALRAPFRGPGVTASPSGLAAEDRPAPISAARRAEVDCVAQPDEPTVSALLVCEGERAVDPPTVVPREAVAEARVNEQADLIDEAALEQGTDEPATAVHAHGASTVDRQPFKSVGQIDPVSRCPATQCDDVPPMARAAQGVPGRDAAAGVDNGQQRAVRVRARPRRRGGEGRLLSEDGVRPRERDVLTPRGS